MRQEADRGGGRQDDGREREGDVGKSNGDAALKTMRQTDIKPDGRR
jgi:hypothetical protein